MKNVEIIIKNKPAIEKLSVVYCDGFFCRLRGLMFRNRINWEDGLLLVNRTDSRIDSSIHMFFVFMDLGIVWIDSRNKVVDKIVAKSWAPFHQPKEAARFTLEIHPDRINDFYIGDIVDFING